MDVCSLLDTLLSGTWKPVIPSVREQYDQLAIEDKCRDVKENKEYRSYLELIKHQEKSRPRTTGQPEEKKPKVIPNNQIKEYNRP